MDTRYLARIGTIAAFAGAVLLFVSTLLHLMGSEPNDAPHAFTEYAADSLWMWSHLGQFAGIGVLGIALVALVETVEPGRAAPWARFPLAGTVATLAVAAAL
jgi:hypothetical protein